PRMAPLFQDAFPAAAVIAADDKPKDGALLAGVAYQASFSALGQQFRPSMDSFRASPGYLKPNRDLAATLRANYLQGRAGADLVGISWRSRNPDAEPEKSMSLADLGAVLEVPGVTFVSLQYGDCAAEIADTNRKFGTSIVHDPSVDPLKDMAAFAAQTA